MGTYSASLIPDPDGTLAANSDSKTPTQKATKTYVDAKLTNPANLNGIGFRPSGLGSWFSKFDSASAATPVDVVLITDSIWDLGTNATNPSPSQLLHRQLNALKSVQYADTGSLPDPVHAQSTNTQGTIASTASLGWQGSTLTDTQTLSHTATATGFSIAYRTEPGFGSMTIRDGAGGTILATINCSATAKSGNIWNSGALSDGSHTLHITSSGTTCPEIIYPTRNTRVRVWPCGLAGSQTSQYVSTPAAALDLINTFNSANTLGLVLVCTGTNDDGNYSTSMPSLISSINSITSANIAVWFPYISSAFPQSEHDAALSTFLGLNVGVKINAATVMDRVTLFTQDGVHPTESGKNMITTHLTSVIGGDPIGSALRAAVDKNTGKGTVSASYHEYGITLHGDTALMRASSGTLVAGSPSSILSSTPDGIVWAGARRVVNTQTGTSLSIALADQAKLITRNNASASTQIWPSDATAPIPNGTIIDTANIGTGSVTHSAGSGATVTGTTTQLTGTITRAVKTSNNTWFLGNVNSSDILIDEDNMISDTATRAPTQQSTKAYVDNQTATKAPINNPTFTGTITGNLIGEVDKSNGASGSVKITTFFGYPGITLHNNASDANSAMAVIPSGLANSLGYGTNAILTFGAGGASAVDTAIARTAASEITFYGTSSSNKSKVAVAEPTSSSHATTKTYVDSRNHQLVAKESGQYYSMSGLTTSSTLLSMTASGVLTSIPVFLQAGSYDRIAVVTTVAADSTWRFGVYPSDTSSGIPDGQTLILDCGTIDMNQTAGMLTATISLTIPSTGIYWIAGLVDSYTATPTAHGWTSTSGTAQTPLLGAPVGNSAATAARHAIGRTATGVTTGSMPTTYPTSSSWTQSAPRYFVRAT